MNNPTDLMLDIETLGTDPGAVVLSVAMVEFNIDTGHTFAEYYWTIDLQDSLDKGFVINAGTLKWWTRQDSTVFDEALTGEYGVESFVTRVARALNTKRSMKIWGNSNRFDIGILKPYLDLYIHVPLWDFRDERDVRTLVSFNPEIKHNTPFTGSQHDPIDDCKHQIKYCTKIWNSLKNNND